MGAWRLVPRTDFFLSSPVLSKGTEKVKHEIEIHTSSLRACLLRW